MKKYTGFSLIELLVVIAVTATFLAIVTPNYLAARQRAQDAKKKEEARQVAAALRMYYTDYKTYPEAFSSYPKLNYIKGCKADGAQDCPCSSSVDFAAGGTGCDTVYMRKFPSALGNNTMSYYFNSATPNDFCLTVTLENANDTDLAPSQARCGTICTSLGASCTTTNYCVCSE